jgi:glycosyltransferase involved in cell wall biosynthesis
MLEQITPLILTYNEAPNIGRALEELRWARDIVVVDSFSEDATLATVAEFGQARVFQRKFDSFAAQCNFGLSETKIASEWVLSMDADYILTPELIDELDSLQPEDGIEGYRVHFHYCVNGRQLRSGVYPPVTVLYRRAGAQYRNDGHAHRVVIEGRIADLESVMLHDDRKPLSRWFESQQKYMALEAKKLLGQNVVRLSGADRIRRMRVIAPLAVLFYCLIIRGGVLDGLGGFYYAFQRMLAELILSLYLIEDDLRMLTGRERKKAPEEKAEKALGASL